MQHYYVPAAQNPRMNSDEKAGNRLTVCEEELL